MEIPPDRDLMVQRLTFLVAVALILVSLLAVFAVPERPPGIITGTFPVSAGFVVLPNPGSYLPLCSLTSFPTRWAVFISPTNGVNRSFHLTGTWKSIRPTGVEAFSFGDHDDPQVLADLGEPGSCPRSLLYRYPNPPPLPYGGTVDLNLTTFPGATRIVLVVFSFDSADVVTVTQPFALTPA
jgi:hypothetical protein